MTRIAGSIAALLFGLLLASPVSAQASADQRGDAASGTACAKPAKADREITAGLARYDYRLCKEGVPQENGTDTLIPNRLDPTNTNYDVVLCNIGETTTEYTVTRGGDPEKNDLPRDACVAMYKVDRLTVTTRAGSPLAMEAYIRPSQVP
jgi:hypothetical protein